YGPRVKGEGRGPRERRAQEMLELVQLGALRARRPAQLSGGPRQRVRLARAPRRAQLWARQRERFALAGALINRPKVLLLDEPLGALDLKLREEMQIELKSIQAEVESTFRFVTHAQGEALSMSSRIAVFNNGRIEQVGVPRDVYEAPQTTFVATFVGTSNVLSAPQSHPLLGVAAAHSLRPERTRSDGDPVAPDEAEVSGTVQDVLYLGSDTRVRT